MDSFDTVQEHKFSIFLFIAGIVAPNDGNCHMNKGQGTEVLKYSKSHLMDYPSISFLKQKMKDNKIVPIIAAVENVKGVYEAIQKVKDTNPNHFLDGFEIQGIVLL